MVLDPLLVPQSPRTPEPQARAPFQVPVATSHERVRRVAVSLGEQAATPPQHNRRHRRTFGHRHRQPSYCSVSPERPPSTLLVCLPFAISC